MRKKYILFITVAILIIVGLLTWMHINSFHDIRFIVKQPGLTIEVYKKIKETDKKIGSITSSDLTMTLQSGEYYYSAKSGKVDSTNNNFTVEDSNKTIDIDPDYSKVYLENILKSEKSNILKVIENIYPNEKYNYNISSSELFKKGEWFGAIISRRTNRFDSTDLYLIIMNKTDGKWAMVHYPEIVATKTNFPDVPIEVLNSVNSLASN